MFPSLGLSFPHEEEEVQVERTSQERHVLTVSPGAAASADIFTDSAEGTDTGLLLHPGDLWDQLAPSVPGTLGTPDPASGKAPTLRL